jgi:hypothetical protein
MMIYNNKNPIHFLHFNKSLLSLFVVRVTRSIFSHSGSLHYLQNLSGLSLPKITYGRFFSNCLGTIPTVAANLGKTGDANEKKPRSKKVNYSHMEFLKNLELESPDLSVSKKTELLNRSCEVSLSISKVRILIHELNGTVGKKIATTKERLAAIKYYNENPVTFEQAGKATGFNSQNLARWVLDHNKNSSVPIVKKKHTKVTSQHVAFLLNLEQKTSNLPVAKKTELLNVKTSLSPSTVRNIIIKFRAEPVTAVYNKTKKAVPEVLNNVIEPTVGEQPVDPTTVHYRDASGKHSYTKPAIPFDFYRWQTYSNQFGDKLPIGYKLADFENPTSVWVIEDPRYLDEFGKSSSTIPATFYDFSQWPVTRNKFGDEMPRGFILAGGRYSAWAWVVGARKEVTGARASLRSIIAERAELNGENTFPDPNSSIECYRDKAGIATPTQPRVGFDWGEYSYYINNFGDKVASGCVLTDPENRFSNWLGIEANTPPAGTDPEVLRLAFEVLNSVIEPTVGEQLVTVPEVLNNVIEPTVGEQLVTVQPTVAKRPVPEPYKLGRLTATDSKIEPDNTPVVAIERGVQHPGMKKEYFYPENPDAGWKWVDDDDPAKPVVPKG